MSVRRERYAGVVRKLRASDPDPEERLEELLAERGREIAEKAERLEETVRDLERREQLLRDSRASIERLLRLGTTDLESREAELVQLMQDVTAREDRVRLEEVELARRREELGAVELKRAAVERRERAVEEREAQLGFGAAGDEVSTELAPVLLFVPGPGYGLREVERPPVRAGDELELDGVDYVVARTGPSPLPADNRRCAYLVRGPRGFVASSSTGSS
jgi:hypothetical protein